jgi:hypothetical protein
MTPFLPLALSALCVATVAGVTMYLISLRPVTWAETRFAMWGLVETVVGWRWTWSWLHCAVIERWSGADYSRIPPSFWPAASPAAVDPWVMSEADRAAQRRSFVYGNCNIDNPKVTREVVEEAERAVDAVPTPWCEVTAVSGGRE